MASLGRLYLRCLQKHTLVTQMITSGTVFTAGDALSQHAIEGTSWAAHDSRRSLRFFTYGTVLWAPISNRWHWFLNTLTYRTRAQTVAVRVGLDMLVFAPFGTAWFFTAMGTLEGRTYGDVRERLRDNFTKVLKTNIAVFGPAQVLNMAFMPAYARPPVMNFVGLAFNTYLAAVNQRINIGEGVEGETKENRLKLIEEVKTREIAARVFE